MGEIGWVVTIVGVLVALVCLLPVPDPTQVPSATQSEGWAIALALRPYLLGTGAGITVVGLVLVGTAHRAKRQQA